MIIIYGTGKKAKQSSGQKTEKLDHYQYRFDHPPRRSLSPQSTNRSGGFLG